jgi:hypothetical protein
MDNSKVNYEMRSKKVHASIQPYSKDTNNQ